MLCVAGGLGMSEEQVNGEEQVRVCVSRAELLTAELHVPVHVQESTPTEAYKQGDASIPDVLLQVASATGQASDQTQVTESNCGGKLSKGGKIFELLLARIGGVFPLSIFAWRVGPGLTHPLARVEAVMSRYVEFWVDDMDIHTPHSAGHFLTSLCGSGNMMKVCGSSRQDPTAWSRRS